MHLQTTVARGRGGGLLEETIGGLFLSMIVFEGSLLTASG